MNCIMNSTALYPAFVSGPRRVGLPIAVYPGAGLVGLRVRDIVTDPQAQAAASLALHTRFQTRVILTAMDLSVEAEAFGCKVEFGDQEVPTVVGRRVTSAAEASALGVPRPGDGRTSVFLQAAAKMRLAAPQVPLVGGCIGPYSLAARLAGVSEVMELTLTEPELVHTLLGKATEFLTRYANAFKAAGADALLMAEPAAGLLSPRALATFSSSYIRRIIGEVADGHFELVLHNCAAKLAHLSSIQEAGARILHFGAPMDLAAALARVDPSVVLCGNLDPSAVFIQSSPDEVAVRTRQLLSSLSAYPNFVISSGCDVPASAPLGNLERFHQVVSEWSRPDFRRPVPVASCPG